MCRRPMAGSQENHTSELHKLDVLPRAASGMKSLAIHVVLMLVSERLCRISKCMWHFLCLRLRGKMSIEATDTQARHVPKISSSDISQGTVPSTICMIAIAWYENGMKISRGIAYIHAHM